MLGIGRAVTAITRDVIGSPTFCGYVDIIEYFGGDTGLAEKIVTAEETTLPGRRHYRPVFDRQVYVVRTSRLNGACQRPKVASLSGYYGESEQEEGN